MKITIEINGCAAKTEIESGGFSGKDILTAFNAFCAAFDKISNNAHACGYKDTKDAIKHYLELEEKGKINTFIIGK